MTAKKRDTHERNGMVAILGGFWRALHYEGEGVFRVSLRPHEWLDLDGGPRFTTDQLAWIERPGGN